MVVGDVPVPVPWFGCCAAPLLLLLLLLAHASTGTCFCFALLCCFHLMGMNWCS